MTDQVEFISFNSLFLDRFQKLNNNTNENDKIQVRKIFAGTYFSPFYIQKYLDRNISSFSIACSEYRRSYIVDMKNMFPQIDINCWWYGTSLDKEQKNMVKESFKQYLRVIDMPVDSVTVDFPWIMRWTKERLMNLNLN